MLLIQARIEPLQYELEESDQVLRVGGSDVDVDVSEGNCGGHGQAETGRLAATAGRCQAVRWAGGEDRGNY